MQKIIDKYKSIPNPTKAALWFFVCSVIQKMISIVSTVVFTRLMTTEDYGLISIYNSWADMLLIFASLNLSVGCFNVGMTRYEKNRAEWVSSLQILSVISAILFSAILAGSYVWTKKYINLPDLLVFVMIITFFFSPAISLWTAKQRYEYSYIKLIIVTIMHTMFAFALSLTAILLSSSKGEAKIVATAVATVIFGILLFIDNIKGSKHIIRKDYVHFAFVYNIQMMPAFLGTVIFSQIDRIMIDHMVNREAAGIYSVAYNAAYVIAIVSTSINATYNPWMMQKIKKNDYSKVDETGNGISFMILILIFLFILCAPEFVKIIAPAEYMQAIYIIPAVAGSTYFNLLYTLFCPVLQYRLKTRKLSMVTVVSAMLNIVLNHFAIQKWGYLAAGYTTYVSYFVYGWATGLYAMYELKKDGYKGKLYDLRKLIMTTLVLTLLVVITPFTYKSYIIRYMILLVSVVIFIRSAKRIASSLEIWRK